MSVVGLLLLAQVAVVEPAGHCGAAIFQRMRGSEVLPVTRVGKRTPPAIGAQRNFWLMDMNVMPPAQRLRSATCRGIGNHCYLFVEDSSYNAGQMDSADVEFILERFNRRSPRDSTKGVWQHNTEILGMPPDIDEDSLIYLMYYDIAGFHGYTFNGFWMFFDEYPDSIAYPRWGYHSNECEIVYLDDYPNNPASDYRVAIAGHEFAHMIHYNYDQTESLWVNEGCAELAMWLYGAPDPISGFNANTDDDLTIWSGQWTDYIQTYLFFLYLYEQYGERVGNPLIGRIVANPLVSIAGIDSTFAELGLEARFRDVFNDWVIANFLDDTASYGGRYGYFGERLPVFTSTLHQTYPVNQTSSVKRWAARYARFQRGQDITIGFDGADEGRLKAQVIARDTVARTFVVDSIALDSVQAGEIRIPDFGTTYQVVILAPANNISAGGPTSYRYTASVAAGIDEGKSLLPVPRNDRCLVTGDWLKVSYAVLRPGRVALSLYGVNGARRLQAVVEAGSGQTLLQLDVSAVPSGGYFLILEQDGRREILPVRIVR